MKPRIFLVATVILGSLATASVAFAAIESSDSVSFDSVVVTRSIRSEPPNSPHLFHNIPNLNVNVADAIYNGPPVACNFADFYQNTKGVERWGFPTSEVYEEGKSGNLVQFYQRGAVGCRYQSDAKTYLLQRVLVWDFFGGDAPGSIDQGVEPGIVSNQPGTPHGPWKHRVSNYDVDGKVTGFLDFFNRLGGVDSFGFPKTDARPDTKGPGMLNIPAASSGIVRQYFQAGVLESYPNDAGAPVQLRLLGDDLRDLQGLGDGAPFKPAAALNAGAPYAVVSLTQAADTPAGGEPKLTRIAFSSSRDGNWEIYVMNADGTGQTRLTDNAASDGGPTWSPDGRRIVFDRNYTNGIFEIYVMNADGTDQKRLSDNTASDWSPTWSPDGRRIAFNSGRDGNREIYVMNADGTGQTRLTDNAAFDGDPTWSPDGRRIAFPSDRDGNQEIYVMNADGSGQTRLTENSDSDFSPSWSPDGLRIAFTSNRDGNWEIYVMNADGTGQTRLTDNAASDYFPDWSPER